MHALPKLPISGVLPQIRESLQTEPNLVLVAPPGAGKTTLVPLTLLDADWRDDRKIIVLEPRRLAARAAAARMASLLGEKPGETVGYRIRFDTRISAQTRIEVVTEGVFTRMLATDAALEQVGAVLFDEFHERSLDSDLALALCLDLQEGLRNDLRLLAMSATLDGTAVADLMSARIIESAGKGFPVETVHRIRQPGERIEAAAMAAVLDELARHDGGDFLVFLPGQGEIERTASLLEERVPKHIEIHRLYGAISRENQDAALRKAADGKRKVVLASAIAETSLTIEGVTTVIDSGLARRPVFEPETGLTRLETVRASQASVTQRAGRAGRLAPGRAVRLWHKGQTAALPAFNPPDILNADLAPLLLDLADWGVTDTAALRWLDSPPASSIAGARKLLGNLGALDDAGALTPYGRALHAIPLPPRMAHMVLVAQQHSASSARRAALLALILQERGVGGRGGDLQQRRENCESSKHQRERNLVRLSGRISGNTKAGNDKDTLPDGVLLATGFPDRVAKHSGTTRQGTVRYQLANGRGAELEAVDALVQEEWLVVVDMSGRAGAARILSAAAIAKTDILETLGEHIQAVKTSHFDPGTGELKAIETLRLGNLDLARPEPVQVDDTAALAAMINAIQEQGTAILPWRESDITLRNRLSLLHKILGEPWPDLSEKHLLSTLDEWLAPYLDGKRSFDTLGTGTLSDALLALAGYPATAELERLVPTHFTTPAGSNVRLNYDGYKVTLSVRPQELFGMNTHPSVLDRHLPLSVELLSPAGRPIQITRDLPGFWNGSWSDVRAELRGRYPKHPWPEDPANSKPTRRAKPRKK